jgi:hypothetical protein
MKFTIEDNLQNVCNGLINKVFTEINYDTKQEGKEILIIGDLVITREFVKQSRVTEIKDRLPIHITIPKNRKINIEAEICLHITNVNYEFEEEFTKFYGEIELTNINEKDKHQV